MSDFVFDSTDQPTLYALAQTMGYWDASIPGPVWQGNLPDNSGQYFLNEVGIIYSANGAPQAGYWSRLRLNGNNPFADGALQIPTAVTVYPPFKYLADGVTIDMTYTQPSIGIIA